MRLLEADEIKLDLLREKLAEGERQLDKGEFIDGEQFMQQLMNDRA